MNTIKAALVANCEYSVLAWEPVAASGERLNVGQIAEVSTLARSTVSHHLKVLTEAGLLTREPRGTQAWFSLVPERLAQIGSIFA